MPQFDCNRSNAAQVRAHLACCDSAFMPPLSARVELDAYAERLIARAERIEAWEADQLVGLVAAYCNDMHSRAGFVTSVSVASPWRGRGIARQLMEGCIRRARLLGMRTLRLEVARAQATAIALYRSLGFRQGDGDEHAGRLIFELEL